MTIAALLANTLRASGLNARRRGGRAAAARERARGSRCAPGAGEKSGEEAAA